jgi:hypothetical protein
LISLNIQLDEKDKFKDMEIFAVEEKPMDVRLRSVR